MTTTDLARQAGHDPRFWTDGNALFNEAAAGHGADFAGVAWLQVYLGVQQGAFPRPPAR